MKLFKDFKENVTYSLDSWNGYFYNHTNDNAMDFKIDRLEVIKKEYEKGGSEPFTFEANHFGFFTKIMVEQKKVKLVVHVRVIYNSNKLQLIFSDNYKK